MQMRMVGDRDPGKVILIWVLKTFILSHGESHIILYWSADESLNIEYCTVAHKLSVVLGVVVVEWL